MKHSKQQNFDARYIATPELCSVMGVTRSAISAWIKSGRLPQPIVIRRITGDPQISLWERSDINLQHLQALHRKRNQND